MTDQRGQSLIEVLIAIAVGAVLIVGAAAVIAPSAKTTAQVENVQIETALAKQLSDNVRVWSEGNWNGLLALATGSANSYYLTTTVSPFTATSGVESVVESTSTFKRYFYLTDVYRDGTGNATTSPGGNSYDPSTKLVTVAYNRPQSTTSTVSFYVTRNITDIYDQSDWSGGPGNNGPVTSTISQFVTSTNIAYASTTGSILIASQYTGASSSATTSISSSSASHWAWGDILGWLDFYNNNKVGVSTNGLTGYASSSAGDISLDCHTTRNGNICGTSNYQVLNDGAGDLSGYGWSDGYGWISFSGTVSGSSTAYHVNIDGTGNFQGYAWNDSLGWISFNCDNPYGACPGGNYKVATNWTAATSASTGTLYSTAFDTGDAGGAQFNSILWQGILPAGAGVQFQFAASNAPGGPWTFTGPGGSTSTYYAPSLPGTSIALSYSLYNKSRYFRYAIFLSGTTATGTWSPQVNDVVVNWSP